MDVREALREGFALLHLELTRIADSRFLRGQVHPLEGVLSLALLGLMCGQCSSSAVHRFGDTHPELPSGYGLRRSPDVATPSRLLRMVKVAEVRQAMLDFAVALAELRSNEISVASMDGKTVCKRRRPSPRGRSTAPASGPGKSRRGQPRRSATLNG